MNDVREFVYYAAIQVKSKERPPYIFGSGLGGPPFLTEHQALKAAKKAQERSQGTAIAWVVKFKLEEVETIEI